MGDVQGLRKIAVADANDAFFNAAAVDALGMPLGQADQSCKECWRRKAKCNRAMPTCGACSKYGRHCLYEKHSRTPLTRKHLTEVEERLERAERLLRQARLDSLRYSNLEHTLQEPNSSDSLTPNIGTASTIPWIPSLQMQDQDFDFRVGSTNAQFSAADDSFTVTEFSQHNLPAVAAQQIEDEEEEDEEESHPSKALDGPPTVADNFEWDEQQLSASQGTEFGKSLSRFMSSEDGVVESTVVDGMASLTMSEKEGGYLGVASGAALLRVIDPSMANFSTQRNVAAKSQHAKLSFISDQTSMRLYAQPNPSHHIAEYMIDAYFRHFNLNYPIIHEPTFRAEYSEVIERPNGNCWKVLAYAIAAIGVFATTTAADTTDLILFAQAKSLMHWNYLESGNLTLVQALTLMSNYLQKRDRPNSGYNYLGLAIRIAISIGLHREFPGWKIRPLKMEIRRRVWWCLCVFDLGATITFGRPSAWPAGGIDVALPMNVHDHELTAASQENPTPLQEITPYTAIRAYSSFYLATNPVYSRIISTPFPSAKQLLALDDQHIGGWYASLPSFFSEHAWVPPKYRTSHAVLMWKYRNLKIIIYRPYVIKQALSARQGHQGGSPEWSQAFDRCLHEARLTIFSIVDFWNSREHTRIDAWYALYFLFQAALIPCICLRNQPSSPNASEWKGLIEDTLTVIKSIGMVNPSGDRCHEVISGLCDRYLSGNGALSGMPDTTPEPIDESPQTQMDNFYSMLWPNFPATETDAVMQDNALTDLLWHESPITEGATADL